MKRLLALALFVALAHPALAADKCMPFAGERMSFDVSWEFINAGSATMTIVADDRGWKTQISARTNRVLDLFKKVRDTISATGTCLDGRIQSLSFDVEQHENRYHSIKQTRFDWQRNQVRYTQKGETTVYDVPAGHLSVVDAFLLTRTMPLQPGDEFRIPVFDSRKRYQVLVRVLNKRPMLRVPWGGVVPCVILEPKLKTEGIFSSKGTMKIWVTDDERHIPVKVVAKIRFGHIVGTLEAYDGPAFIRQAVH